MLFRRFQTTMGEMIGEKTAGFTTFFVFTLWYNDLLGTSLGNSCLRAQRTFQKIAQTNNVVLLFEATLRDGMKKRFMKEQMKRMF